jgi:xanthine dehydrogenase accessory factor
MMENLYLRLDADLTAGRDLVLARIVHLVGSGPRSVGSACIIYADGTFWGTVGGGLIEHRVLASAPGVFESGRTCVLPFRMTGKDLERSEMVCGGVAEVYLEPLEAAHAATCELFSAAAELVRHDRQGALFTRVADGIPARDADLRLLLLPDGRRMGALGTATDDIALVGRPELAAGVGGQRVFADPVAPEAVLTIFGGGHVATCLAPLAASVGFRVAVVDDRPDFIAPQRFPGIDALYHLPFADAFSRLAITSRSYIAIMTPGHASDLTVLRQAVRSEAAYIGMMASSRKRQMIRDTLLAEGVNPARLDDVYSPIGIAIAAETPAEIAVSIVGELIRVRAARQSKGRG